MRSAIVAVLCLAFAIWTSGQTQVVLKLEVQKVPVAITWDYEAQHKMLTLHLVNNTGKDITAYNISIAERYADGSTNYADGRPNDIHDHQQMEDLLNVMINVQQAGWDWNAFGGKYGNGTFPAGARRDQVIPESKDISDVDAVADMVAYADATADVQNEQAFRQLLAVRKGQLLAMEKADEIIRRVLADPKVDSPISAVLAELIPLADAAGAKNHSGHPDEENQDFQLLGDIQDLKSMQRAKMTITEREYLARCVEEHEKRIALMSPHCHLEITLK